MSFRPSREPSNRPAKIPTRSARRKTLRHRLKRYWREALAVLFVLVLVSTAAIVVNFRADEPEEKQDTWREKIQVSGTVGRIPTISLSSAVSVASVKMSDLEVGMGREITEGSPLIVALWSFDGATGQALTDSGRGNVQVGLATAEDFDEVLLKGVVGKTEGSRVLFVRPVESGGRVSTEINVVDILHSAASGEVVEGKDSPLRVTITDTGPNIAHDAGNPPADLQVQMLIAGDGEQVGSNDNVLMQYVLANWEDSVVVDSTWWTGVPKAINIAEAMPGVRLALIDQRVGSRVAITIPPEMASGDSTVTMVVDIIATQAQGGTLTPSTTVKEEVTS